MARLDVTEMFHGILFPGHLHTQESLQLALKFPFQDTDILIASYPKSGTTWMQEIVTLISGRGDPHLTQNVPNWTRAPWLEQYYCAAVLEASSTTPRVITTHLPHHLLGPTLQGSKAKVIYVSRNPKDVVVSFYHFHKIANFLPEAGTFPEFLDRFLEGTLNFGSWFDHFKGWTSQTATMGNLLHITYEEMSLDLHGAIKRVSSFLQCPLVEDEVKNCVKYCSFTSMKDNKMVNYTLVPDEIMDHSKGSFMRKGKAGDWKNMFTEEQNQYFESIFKSKMQDCTFESKSHRKQRNCEKEAEVNEV
ncbi:sulfotransferase family cytosolic 2B member 1-like [Seriola lalandi dorsalis]|uniref:Sulfotransferase n=1 Tax=Seriola lalandi dorsalis TaxID=1841481 RepID=A0A3B4YI48_SERLL|nr:sulfotransferase family cytosolic 2B member 1-like [Seriola lalandi dorsalis]XP_056234748.1 sulfotransferase family 5A, member 1 [Seriola aureovittata]